MRSELQRRSRLPPEECVQLALNLTLALGHLHRHGLIHRDIKPANIIFVQDIPKLADIGLVTTFDRDVFVCRHGRLYRAGRAIAADLFSLGKVLYEIQHRQGPWISQPPTGLGESGCRNRRSERGDSQSLRADQSNAIKPPLNSTDWRYCRA